MAKSQTKQKTDDKQAKSSPKPGQPELAHSKEQYQTWYRQMQLMRRFEEKAGQMYGQQKIRGFCHLYIGQEAVAAATVSALRADDPIITAYRDHAHALAVGISPREVMAELFGKRSGSSKGKGGSMHFFAADKRLFGGHGIVGAQIPLGAGIAFAEKYRRSDKVCATFMGDGAVRQGALHETFNMAMTWSLPVVFIIENNRYAMGTSVERSSNVLELHRIGEGYDMPHWDVDGMDVEAVHEALSKAATMVRDAQTPVLLEMVTYRYKGHSISDPAKYRTREEVNEARANDPIKKLGAKLTEAGLFTEDELKAFDDEAKEAVEDAVAFADREPFPDPAELYDDVYKVPGYPYLIDSY
jgi:pyruvate dehydrogenase E1 component alpha subunit